MRGRGHFAIVVSLLPCRFLGFQVVKLGGKSLCPLNHLSGSDVLCSLISLVSMLQLDAHKNILLVLGHVSIDL